MRNRRNTFLFKDTEVHDGDIKDKRDIHLKTQVIVCGSQAHKFIACLNDNNLSYHEEEEFPSFFYVTTGTLRTFGHVTLSSDINYCETRNKKAKSIFSSPVYEHVDNIQTGVTWNNQISETYITNSADFNLPETTWVFFMGQDNSEQQLLIEKINNIQKNSHTKWFIAINNDSKGIQIDFSRPHDVCEFDNGDVSIIAHDFKKNIKKDHLQRIEQLKLEIIEEFKNTANKEIETKVKKKAEEYFENVGQKRCITM